MYLISRQHILRGITVISIICVLIFFAPSKNKTSLTLDLRPIIGLPKYTSFDLENGFHDMENQQLMNLLLMRWIRTPSTLPYNLSHPDRSKKDLSQMGQDTLTLVKKLLGNRQNGFFVECGALDGETHSNSLLLELFEGWRGLLVEPNPEMFRKIVNKNRKAYIINAAVSSTNSTERLEFNPEGMAGGLITDTQDPDSTVQRRRGSHAITVQCFPLYSMLLAIGETRIDYLSLDIEGLEYEVLLTIPWDKVWIDVIIIEYRIYDEISKKRKPKESVIKLNKLRQFFEERGTHKEVTLLPEYPEKKISKKYMEENVALDVVFKHV